MFDNEIEERNKKFQKIMSSIFLKKVFREWKNCLSATQLSSVDLEYYRYMGQCIGYKNLYPNEFMHIGSHKQENCLVYKGFSSPLENENRHKKNVKALKEFNNSVDLIKEISKNFLEELRQDISTSLLNKSVRDVLDRL